MKQRVWYLSTSLGAVFVGGALGTLSRFALGGIIGRAVHIEGIPVGTLIVNWAACFIIGILAEIIHNHHLRLFACVGFLGGFSTLAAVVSETQVLIDQGAIATAFAYNSVTYAGSLLFVSVGYIMAKKLIPRINTERNTIESDSEDLKACSVE